jgi:hypothetical protein
MALENFQQDIINNSQTIIKEISLSILSKLKPYLEAGLIIICLYLIYRLIRSFFAWRERKRSKKTYENTEKILETLDRIEKKIEQLGKKEEKPKPERKKKKS